MSETMERIRPILYAATRQGIVILAGDGGEVEVLPFALNGTHVTALAADAKGVLLAAGTASRGTLVTRDGGKTFTPAGSPGGDHVVALQTSGAMLHAAIEPAALHCGGSTGGLKPSAGFAKVWRERHTGGAEARITALLARGTRVLVASDRGSVFLSEDGGEAFREVAGGLPEPVLCLHAPAGAPDAVLAGTGAGLYRSGRPGTEPWKHVFSDEDRPAVTAIGSDPGGALVCGVARFLAAAKPGAPAGADAALLGAGDGRTFERATIAALRVVRGRMTAVRFTPNEPARVFAGSTAGEIFESRDGGKTFRLAAGTIPGVLDLAVGPALV